MRDASCDSILQDNKYAERRQELNMIYSSTLSSVQSVSFMISSMTKDCCQWSSMQANDIYQFGVLLLVLF